MVSVMDWNDPHPIVPTPEPFYRPMTDDEMKRIPKVTADQYAAIVAASSDTTDPTAARIKALEDRVAELERCRPYPRWTAPASKPGQPRPVSVVGMGSLWTDHQTITFWVRTDNGEGWTYRLFAGTHPDGLTALTGVEPIVDRLVPWTGE